MGELQVKLYQPTSAQVLIVCLNVATHLRYWEGISPDLLEYMLSLTASLVDRGIQNGYRVGLISNGCLTNSDQPFHTQPGRSPQQLATLLSALAGITPVVVAPFERLLLREIPRAPVWSDLAHPERGDQPGAGGGDLAAEEARAAHYAAFGG